MNWLDIVITVCVIIGIIHGLMKGIVKQVISLVALIAAILLSGAVAGWIRNLLQPYFQGASGLFSPVVQNAIFYILAFVLIIFLFSIVANLVDKVINFTPVGILNKLFGALFGLFMWVICLSILLNFIAVFDSQSTLISKPVKENSIYYDKVKIIFPTICPYINEFIKEKIHV